MQGRSLHSIASRYGFDCYNKTAHTISYVCRVVGRGSIGLTIKTNTGEWCWRGPTLGDKVEGLGAASLQEHLDKMAQA